MFIITEVDSTSIKSVAYDKEEEKLWLRFKSDALYEYRGVQEQTVKELVTAESKGKFFHENIKNKFDYEKVEEE
jgi:hypothetical protein